MRPPSPLHDHVLNEIRVLTRKHGSKVALARRLGIKKQSLSAYFKGDRAFTLPFLEAVSDLSHKPIAELVAPNGSELKQLEADESRLLRHYRSWPPPVQQALLVVLDYFADEPPASLDARNLSALFRASTPRQREAVLSFARIVAEKDVLEALLEFQTRSSPPPPRRTRRGSSS